ncbi:nucleotidyltransferase family protein [Cuniculiplasma sp. SKW4]|uniref:nucleotidyltransferase family protein n=1 Tax=Cuniculiplasma sp. SKW4 TaxID=3400171 RepID=UPI003FD221FE
MIGAILSGGYGKRLKPITDEIPKVLVEIKENYTIMDRQLLDFKSVGIKDVYILSGHLGEKIEERYGSEHNGMRFHYLREEKPMGTLYSVRNLLKNTNDEDIILRNGDVVTDINYGRFARFGEESQYGMTMLVTKMKSPYGIVELLGDQVVSFREKPVLDHYINSGMYYIKSKIRDLFFNDYNGKDIETTVYPELARRKEIGAYREDSFWIGVDSEKELELVRKEYLGREDTDFGYMRNIYSKGKMSIVEYFLKDGSTVSINRGNIIRFIHGDGIITNGNGSLYTAGKVMDLENNVDLKAFTPTKLEVLSY